MPIRTIELICAPCHKCEGLEEKIRKLVKAIGMVLRIEIIYEFKRTTNLRNITQYSLNPSQTPAVLVNGKVEFAGRFDLILLRRRLEAIQRSC